MIIIGAKGKINVEDVLKRLKKLNCKFAQIVNADYVCGKEHLIVAYELAKRAFKNRRNICKNIEMEFLVYASAKKQIKDALAVMGAKDRGNYAFVFDGMRKKDALKFVKDLGLKIDDKVIEPTIKKIKKFVNEKELKTIDKSFYFDLIFEKMAMMETLK